MNNEGKEISVGNAAKIASELTTLALSTGLDPEAILEVYDGFLQAVATKVIATSEAHAPDFVPSVPGPQPFNPEAAVQAAFPGTTVVATPAAPAPANVVAFPTPAAAAPAAIPGASAPGAGDPQVAQAWDQFFADIASGQFASNWDDNRGSKKGENSPDFKHKSWKLPGQRYTVSLWITGKKNPADLAGRLAQVGIA